MTASPKLKELCSGLDLNDEVLRQYMKVFQEELVSGLQDRSDSSLKCLITYVHHLPKGEETGCFLSLHFASVLLRVSVITMKIGSFDLRAKQYLIPSSLTTSSGEQLFDYLAECVYEFTSQKHIHNKNLPLGFTFGFPLVQTSVKSGVSTAWTKEFKCSGVIGKDVVVLLEKAIAKIPDLKVEVTALINDTVGTLLSCAWKRPICKVGAILDAGANVCYVEKVKDVPKYKGPDKHVVVINTECGNMGANGCMDFLLTAWDKEVDKKTRNPGAHILEKAIASRYMGELVRRVLLTAAQRSIILKGRVSNVLNTPDTFDPNYLVLISKEPKEMAEQVLSYMGYESLPQDQQDFLYVCELVWTRSAHLLAASIAAILQHIQYKEVAVGFDGMFYRNHGAIRKLVEKKINELVDQSMKVKCQVVDDRGGLGAALAATIDFEIQDENVDEIHDDETDEIRQSRVSLCQFHTESHDPTKTSSKGSFKGSRKSRHSKKGSKISIHKNDDDDSDARPKMSQVVSKKESVDQKTEEKVEEKERHSRKKSKVKTDTEENIQKQLSQESHKSSKLEEVKRDSSTHISKSKPHKSKILEAQVKTDGSRGTVFKESTPAHEESSTLNNEDETHSKSISKPQKKTK